MTRHSSAAPVPAAARQSLKEQKFRSASSSQPSSRPGYSFRASACSPLPLPPAAGPAAAATAACEPHSLTVTTRTFGNGAGPAGPALDPKNARFAAVSGTSHSIPSTDISRHGPRNAPAVSRSATGTATCENTPATGSGPSRCRAWVIPPRVGTSHSFSQQPHPRRVCASRAATSS